jgi:hypothetical protein
MASKIIHKQYIDFLISQYESDDTVFQYTCILKLLADGTMPSEEELNSIRELYATSSIIPEWFALKFFPFDDSLNKFIAMMEKGVFPLSAVHICNSMIVEAYTIIIVLERMYHPEFKRFEEYAICQSV